MEKELIVDEKTMIWLKMSYLFYPLLLFQESW